MPISIFLSFCHVLPHIIMPFFNMQRSFRVCVHARVAMHAYESGRKCFHIRNKTFFEGIMLVENEPPPAAKAGYGPGEPHTLLVRTTATLTNHRVSFQICYSFRTPVNQTYSFRTPVNQTGLRDSSTGNSRKRLNSSLGGNTEVYVKVK